jgi:hypothetical protein
LAGAIAASTFILIVAVNDLIDKDMGLGAYEYLSALIIIFTLSAGPGLFAGALRRFDGVHTNRTGKWERMIDYALSPLITSWVVWKVLEATVKFTMRKNLPSGKRILKPQQFWCTYLFLAGISSKP